MRILRGLAVFVLGVVAALIAASLVYNAVTSDANVPVRKLWHGTFEGGTAYRSWGASGPAVILVGGFLEPSFVWDSVGPLLGTRARVYALDLDGFGYSERRGPWTLAHWADQVETFARSLGLSRPIVVGHSLGAAVAVELARRGFASRIVLVDGDAVGGAGPPRWVRRLLVRSPFFTTAYRFALRSPWLVRRLLRNAYGPHHPPLDDAEIRRWTDQFRAQDARQALEGIAENGLAGFTRAQLARIHAHALVVWGASDSVDPASEGRKTAAELRAPFIELRGAGHLSMTEAARVLAAAIAR